jgi:hypothetical protein
MKEAPPAGSTRGSIVPHAPWIAGSVPGEDAGKNGGDGHANSREAVKRDFRMNRIMTLKQLLRRRSDCFTNCFTKAVR